MQCVTTPFKRVICRTVRGMRQNAESDGYIRMRAAPEGPAY